MKPSTFIPMSRAIFLRSVGEMSRPPWSGTVRPAAIGVPELHVGTALSHAGKAQAVEDRHDLARFEDRNLGHLNRQ
jgi:hypothetical protein